MSASLEFSLAPTDCRGCNATITRAVRWTLMRYVRSVVAMTGVSLQQESCPLSALLALSSGAEPTDCFSSQDNRSLLMQQGRLRCLVCGKMFRSQHYLDRHFSYRHADTLPERAPCLDHLCGVLRCEAHEPGASLAPVVGEACVAAEAAQRQAACKSLFVSCFGGADTPPTSVPTLSSDVRDVLVAEFCSVHSCSLDAERHSRGDIVGALALEWHRKNGATVGWCGFGVCRFVSKCAGGEGRAQSWKSLGRFRVLRCCFQALSSCWPV